MEVIKKVKFYDQYPAMPEFQKPWECTIRVSQGFGKYSYDGKPLQSEDFGSCTALILRDTKTLDSMLFHIDGSYLEQPDQTKPLREFMLHFIEGQNLTSVKRKEIEEAILSISKYCGPENMTREEFTGRMAAINNNRIKGHFLFGSDERKYRKKMIEESILRYLNITCSSTNLESGDSRFSVVYNPKISRLFVAENRKKELLECIF